MTHLALAGLAAIAATACGPDPRVGPRVSRADAASGTFAEVAERILVPRCASASCHGGAPPPASPQLDEAGAFAATVGIPSLQLPSMMLVEPGDPERSYLVLKLRGTHGAAGGGGGRMPLADAPLDDADEAIVESWIQGGAEE
jgi:hypothetical protein